VVTVARADEFLARAQIGVAQAAGIRLGSAATVSLGDSNLPGKVRALSAGADHRYTLEVAVPHSAGLLAGLQASIRLP